MKARSLFVLLALVAFVLPALLPAQVPTPTPINYVCHWDLGYSTYLGGGYCVVCGLLSPPGHSKSFLSLSQNSPPRTKRPETKRRSLARSRPTIQAV